MYARCDHVGNPGRELVRDTDDEEPISPLNGHTLGYVRDLSHGNGIDIGLGGQVTINNVPGDLDRYYSDDIPFAFQIFLRIRPSLMGAHGMMHSETTPNEK